MNTLRSVQLVFWVVVLSSSANLAYADPIVFASRAAFDAAFPSAAVENWDSFPTGRTFPNGSTTAGITYSSSTGVALVQNIYVRTSNPNTLGRTEGGFFRFFDTMTFGFGSPLVAFGIDVSTQGTMNGIYTATTDTGEMSGSFFDPFPTRFSGQFLGLSTTLPFRTVTISGTGTEFGFVLDTLRAVPAVPATTPEPASLWLLGAAVAGTVFANRRRMSLTPLVAISLSARTRGGRLPRNVRCTDSRRHQRAPDPGS